MRLLVLFLLISVSGSAQRISFSLYGGGSLVTDQSKEVPHLKKQSSQAGYYFAGEANTKLKGLKVGAGISIEKLSLLSQIRWVNINAEDLGRVKSNIASPALTVYGIVGKVFPLSKVSITPQFMAGYVATRPADSSEVSFTYPSTNGLNIGVATIVGYRLGIVTVSARIGLSYYRLGEVDAIIQRQKVRILTVPVAVGGAISF